MKFLKKFVTFALAAGISVSTALGFVGCGTTEKDPVKDPNTNITNPSTPEKPDTENPTPEKPDDGKEEQAKKELAAAVEELNNFVDNLKAKQNFTILSLQEGKQNDRYITKDAVRFESEKGCTYYIADEDGRFSFSIEKQEDGKWHKDVLENSFNMNAVMAPVTWELSGVEWKSYDRNSDKLIGNKSSGAEYEVVVANNICQMKVEYSNSSTLQATIKDVGTTKVALPENVIDDTKPVKVENIYEIVNGEYVFDISAIHDVLEPWLKGDNQFGKDFFAARRLSDKYKTRNVVYIKASEQEFAFGTLYDYDTTKVKFGESHFANQALYDGIASGSILTKEDFKNYLMSIAKNDVMATIPDFDVEYATNDVNYETAHKPQFDAMTKNIFAELDIDGLDEKNVKLAFKTQHGRIGESAGNGYLYSTTWDHYYVVEINGKLELLKVGIHASTSRNEGEIDNVINHPEYWNINGSPVRTPLQKGNEELYKNEAKEATLEL